MEENIVYIKQQATCRFACRRFLKNYQTRQLIKSRHVSFSSPFKHTRNSFHSLVRNQNRMMDRVIFFLLIATTLLVSISGEVDKSVNNPIRQVIKGENDEHLLNLDHQFTLFKSKYEKTYKSQVEHDHRFRVFKANVRRARRHQQLDPSAVHGVTQFSDVTPKEFSRKYLGLKRRFRLPEDTQKATILPTSELPTDFDWREKGAVTPVKNQVCDKTSLYLLKLP